MGRVVLCADTESLVRPMLIGLEDTTLSGHGWLESIADARKARELVRSRTDIDEAWVVASDEVAGVNLAAALHTDNGALPIYLVAFEPGGDLLDKAAKAGVKEILDVNAFCTRFDTEVRRRSLMSEAMALDIDELLDEGIDLDRAVSCAEPARISGESAVRGADAAGGAAVRGQQAPQAASQAKHEPGPLGFDLESYHAISSSQTGRLPSDMAQRAARRSLPAERRAYVLSFLSGSGGVGKSTVSAMAAYLAAAKGFRTVVLDCDLQFGDLHTLMGEARRASIDEVLADPSAIAALEKETEPGMPVLVSAPDRLERSEVLGCHLGELIDACSQSFDVVIANTGSSWAEMHAQLLERSSCAVFLLDQRASSVRACQHALDLCLRLGIATGSFVYALNRCKRGALFNAIDIANVMQGAHVFELKDGGSEVEELLGAGLASELVAGRNELCASVDEMLDELLPSNGSLFSRDGHQASAGGPGRQGRFVMPEARTKRRGRARRNDPLRAAGQNAVVA